jgi:FKBP-type peptidyl-prolyl cis-trans isomerase SlyD
MSPAPEIVADGAVVLLKYVLRDDAGEILDQADAEDPLSYLHGADNIVPGLEKALSGRRPGEKFDVAVAPEEGYGAPSGSAPQRMDRSVFPPGAPLETGMSFGAELDDGDVLTLWIVAVEPEHVLVGVDHPLAGKTLHFSVEVLSLREATASEREHGHPHGPTGHEGH